MRIKKNTVAPIRLMTSDQVFNNRIIAFGGGVFIRYSMAFTTKTDQRISVCRFVNNSVKNSGPDSPWTFGGGGVCVMVDTHTDEQVIPVNVASKFDGNTAAHGAHINLIGTKKMSGLRALRKPECK